MAEIFFIKCFRTKIQAQRKFAQGQQPPCSAYLSYNLTSGAETPVKEKSQERELLPNLRPNTEDFLTFLCFRGTNSLPKELDFQNSLNQPSTSGTAAKSSKASPDKKNKDAKPDSKKKSASKKTETVTSAKAKDFEKVKPPPDKDPKTGFMPFAVRKRAEVHPAKSDKKKLQTATKKKQQQKAVEVSKDDEASSELRVTRANHIEESTSESVNNKSKKINKRKSALAETSTEVSVGSAKKNESTNSVEKVPSDSFKKGTKTDNNKKSAKNEDEKRQTRLSAIKNPSSSTPKETARNGNESSEYEKYFSSDDDDEPLIKSEPKNKKAKLQDVPAKSNQDLNKSYAKNSLNNNTKSQNSSQPTAKSNRGRKKRIISQSEPDQSKESATPPEPVASTEKVKVGRKKKLNVDLEIANSQANTTDLSENEARGRPMRKTKEAATIYMELIGRKLTLQDSSDNDSSLDSLEVPNLKRVELLENELKANCEKAKEVKAEKKKQEDFRVNL